MYRAMSLVVDRPNLLSENHQIVTTFGCRSRLTGMISIMILNTLKTKVGKMIFKKTGRCKP